MKCSDMMETDKPTSNVLKSIWSWGELQRQRERMTYGGRGTRADFLEVRFVMVIE